MTRPIVVLRALGAALASIALLVVVPWILVATVGNPLPEGPVQLNNRITDGALIGLLAVITWIVWAQFAACFLWELGIGIAQLRHRRVLVDPESPPPGTFAGQQQLARVLVTAILALLAGGTAAVGSQALHPNSAVADEPSPDLRQAEVTTRVATPSAPTEWTSVTVQRGDSLWRLAELHLGNGESWRAIADLNLGRTMNDGSRFDQASELKPGWELRVPAVQARSVGDGEVLVREGDSLWGISEDLRGSGASWPALYDANHDVIEDPNLIYPGERLQLPTGWQPHAEGTKPQHPPRSAEGESSPAPVPAPRPSPTPVEPDVGDPTQVDRPQVAAVDSSNAVLATALTGGGVLLAASLAVLLQYHRRRQEDARRPGRSVPTLDPAHVPTEQRIRDAGEWGSKQAQFLDRALRRLVGLLREDEPLPDLMAVSLTTEVVRLHLRNAGRAPTPWTSDDEETTWSLRHQDFADDGEDAIPEMAAPYPTLVTVGIGEDGAFWLLDLESAGSVTVEADRERAAAFLRFAALELGVNPWSDEVAVIVSGLEDSLDGFNDRVTVLTEPPTQEVTGSLRRLRDALGDREVLEARRDPLLAESFYPTVLVALDASEDLALTAEQQEWRGRAPVALLRSGNRTPPDTTRLRIDDRGMATLDLWEVTISVNACGPDEAAVITGRVRDAQSREDVPMPLPEGARPIDEMMDAAGALRSELVEAATHLAVDREAPLFIPVIPEQTRTEVMSADRGLDADLAAWWDEASPQPKLGVLGLVELTASGRQPVSVKDRLASVIELAAYLGAHPRGVTINQVAQAFGIATNSLQSRITELRKWLGKDPSGEPYLPTAHQSPAARAQGLPRYQIVGLLSDADLFVRLRARGEARGSEGLEDLVAALRLVRGRPYETTKAAGYRWLAGEVDEHVLLAAVMDVAHEVGVRAMADGDVDLALWASRQALKADPESRRARLALNKAGAASRVS